MFDYDLMIIGGGMVGASLAVALADSGYQVAVVETHPFGSAKQPSYDDRSIALSYGSRRIFETFGLWVPLLAGTAPINTIHVSDQGRFGITRIHARDENVQALGYVIENRSIGRTFSQRLERSAVEYICPASLQSIEQHASHVNVALLSNGTQTRKSARLLVAADGAQSTVRRLAGISVQLKDYHQSAIISNVTPQKAHQSIAYERFTRNGPLAMLPMQNHEGQARCSLVWTLPSNEASQVMQLNDREFLNKLQLQFGYRLGALLKTGERSLYPLKLSSSQQSISRRVVLIGNAKQTLHPVAGQGFNLALRDVAELYRLLISEGQLEDVGASNILETYAQLRQADRQRVIQFTDSLITWFSNPLKPLGVVRGLSLFAMDMMPYLRHRFAKFSMGLSQ